MAAWGSAGRRRDWRRSHPGTVDSYGDGIAMRAKGVALDDQRPRSTASALRTLGIAALVLAAAGGCGRPTLSDDVPREVLAASDGGPQWYRGNLHAHTLWTDGDDYPEMVADWYR